MGSRQRVAHRVSIRNLIREDKIHQIYSSMQSGKKFGMPCFGLGKASLRSGNFLFNFGGCPPDFFVCFL